MFSDLCWPYPNSVFNFLRNLYSFTVLLKMSENSNFSTSLSTFILFSIWKNHSHPSECKCYLTGILICISLMTNGEAYFHVLIGQFFLLKIFFFLLAVYISPLEKILFKCFTHFKNGFSSCCWVVGVLYIFWISNSPDTNLAKIL